MSWHTLVADIERASFVDPLFNLCSPSVVLGRRDLWRDMGVADLPLFAGQERLLTAFLQDPVCSFEEKLVWLKINPAEWCDCPNRVHVAEHIINLVVCSIFGRSLSLPLDPLRELRSRIGLLRAEEVRDLGERSVDEVLPWFGGLHTAALRSFLISDEPLSAHPKGDEELLPTGYARNGWVLWPWLFELLHLPTLLWNEHMDSHRDWFGELQEDDVVSFRSRAGIGRIHVPAEFGGVLVRTCLPQEFNDWLSAKGLIDALEEVRAERFFFSPWQSRGTDGIKASVDDCRAGRWRDHTNRATFPS